MCKIKESESFCTFSLRLVSLPLFPWGYITAKYRSTAITTSVNAEETPPNQPSVPPVTNLHKALPASPSGWVKVRLRMNFGERNIAKVMSATARFTRR